MMTVSVKFPDGWRDVPASFDTEAPRSPVDGSHPPKPILLTGWKFAWTPEGWIAAKDAQPDEVHSHGGTWSDGGKRFVADEDAQP